MSSHWYPGHMAKAKQTIKENLKNVDVVIEVRDARLPDSSGNPDIHHLLRDKPSVLVLNKADLADSYLTKLWEKHYEHQGREVAIMNSLKGQGKNNLLEKIKDISSSKFSAMKLKGRRMRAVRLMVIGIPNVGKSQLINCLANRKMARTGDRPGVTRGKQWIHIDQKLALLDMPGILWARQKDPQVQQKLNIIAALDNKMDDLEKAAIDLIQVLMKLEAKEYLKKWTHEKEDVLQPEEVLKAIGKDRGFLIAGGSVDLHKAAVHFIRDFQAGKYGRITLEEPPREEVKKDQES